MAKVKEDKDALKKIIIPTLHFAEMELMLESTSPMLSHRYDGTGIDNGDPVDPADEPGVKPRKEDVVHPRAQEKFLASIHWTHDHKPGFPGAGFKKTAVEASKLVAGVPKDRATRAFIVLDEIVELEGAVPQIYSVIGRIKGKFGGAIPVWIHRARYETWKAKLRIRFNQDLISVKHIVALYNMAGMHVGVGDWRAGSPAGGNFGFFKVCEEGSRVTE